MPFQDKKKTERELHSVVSYTELPILIPMLPRNSILQKLQDKKCQLQFLILMEQPTVFFFPLVPTSGSTLKELCHQGN